ncbi:MAG: HDIG domain-containing protein [Actinomycetia bacterium]|nr:HDIG domain-containing protein [Actinomycetes bacterium]
MNEWVLENKRTVNIGVLVATILLVSIILGIGYESNADIPPEMAIGQPSPETFVADRSIDGISDPEKTEAAQNNAANNVAAPYTTNRATDQGVVSSINAFYAQLDAGAFGEAPEIPNTEVPDVVGMTPDEAQAAAEAANLEIMVVGSVEPPDEESDGTVASQVPAAGATVQEGVSIGIVQYVLGSSSTTAGDTTTSTIPETTTTTLPRVSAEVQIAELLQNYAILTESTIATFVDLHDKDIDRVFEGDQSVFPAMQATSLEWATEELSDGIRSQTELSNVQQKYLNPTTRPPIAIVGLPEEDLKDTSNSIATLVATRLQINESVDETEWAIQRQVARDAVPDQTTGYSGGDTIADEGELLTSVQVTAITQLELYNPEISTVVPLSALILFGIISIVVTAFLLERIAPKILDRPRRVALIGIILVLAAAASRVPEIVAGSNHAVGYIIPAVAIGVMASILFDQRTALLMSIPMAGFTAISTGDIAFTVFAGIAVAIPVAFVSSVSTRSQLRLSVLGSAAVAAPVAAGLEYLFVPEHTGSAALQAAAWAFIGALIGGFIGQGLVSFLENAFGITTSMSLLDLLDRNHPALQLLEEKAPGTFNHSMLVGSIAGKAARSIDADPLLAQAAAWYHDLGKTERPQYYVENQLGYNPHDELPPEESAEIIRSHVVEGQSLAVQFRIPDDVVDGIRMHHGTSLMRYFYHKALTEDPETDPEMFRHHGVKPTRKEMAIVMIADATEAGARAYAQTEQPTEGGLSKLVDTIVAEKLDDGQFDESSLTFGDLTTIKREVVAALAAYYHARVEYPDFPEAVSVEES